MESKYIVIVFIQSVAGIFKELLILTPGSGVSDLGTKVGSKLSQSNGNFWFLEHMR